MSNALRKGQVYIMSTGTSQNPGSMTEALLLTLYVRAMESQRPDALLKDDKAVALVRQMDADFSRIRQAQVGEEVAVAVVLRNREFDRQAQDFLARYSRPTTAGRPSTAGQPQAVVVHIGCGLDSRFERVDNGQVEWYDLDLPEVMELRASSWGARQRAITCWLARCSTALGWTR